MGDALTVEDARDYSRKPNPGRYFEGGQDRERSQRRKPSRRSFDKPLEQRIAAAHGLLLTTLADAHAHNEEITSVDVKEVTREEVIEEITQGARTYLNMTFEEFRDAYRNGTLPDTLAANELIITLRFAGLTREV